MADATLTRVPIFYSGNHKGKAYTDADLDAMCANFALNKGLHDPPAVLGHDEEQILLRGSGLPAAGWPEKLYRAGRTLFADFHALPAAVARLLRGKAYRKVSAEIYDAPPDGARGEGKMLRRVAFLGGDVPHLKELGDIPLPDGFAEGGAETFARVRVNRVDNINEGSYVAFTEVTPVNREQMLQSLAEYGMDLSQVTDAVTDGLLAEILRLADSKTEEADDANAGADDAMKDAKDAKDKAEAPPAAAAAPAAKKKPAKYTEGLEMTKEEINAVVEAAVLRSLEENATGEMARLKKFAEEQHGHQKRGMIDAFLAEKVKEGKVVPAEVDDGSPFNLRAQLYRADARKRVAKFKEGDADVELTELDMQMRQIDARAAVNFGERLRQPAKAGAASEDAEIATIESHYETYAEQFKKNGLKKDTLVAGFKAERKRKDGALTAADYLNSN